MRMTIPALLSAICLLMFSATVQAKDDVRNELAACRADMEKFQLAIDPREAFLPGDAEIAWAVLQQPVAGLALEAVAAGGSLGAEGFVDLPRQHRHRARGVAAVVPHPCRGQGFVFGIEAFARHAPARAGDAGDDGVAGLVAVGAFEADQLAGLAGEFDATISSLT
jgi:hypothetical protein